MSCPGRARDIEIVGVIPWTSPMRVHVASTLPRPSCSMCGSSASTKQTMGRRLVDLLAFGRPVVTLWRQVRLCCPNDACAVRSWMQTGRADRDRQPWHGRSRRPVGVRAGRPPRALCRGVADDLGCDWHTVNRAVIAYGLVSPWSTIRTASGRSRPSGWTRPCSSAAGPTGTGVVHSARATANCSTSCRDALLCVCLAG